MIEVEERGGEQRLAGRVAVVVGAGQTPGETIGNGRATSLLFARHGAALVAVDRIAERAEATAAEIVAGDGRAVAIQADITQPEDCRRIVAETIDAFGAIDVLHYNAGIGGGDGDVTELAPEIWDRIQSVNLKGAYLMAGEVLPSMKQEGRGVITLVSSVASIASMPLVAYKTSKAGLNALAEQIAGQYARHGIRANAILPGLMDTPMAIEGISRSSGVDVDTLRARRNEMVPLGRQMGTAWDVAYAALFLASDEARFVTGICLPVDGGQANRVG